VCLVKGGTMQGEGMYMPFMTCFRRRQGGFVVRASEFFAAACAWLGAPPRQLPATRRKLPISTATADKLCCVACSG